MIRMTGLLARQAEYETYRAWGREYGTGPRELLVFLAKHEIYPGS